MKAVSPGWFGSCFPLFCLTEQTGPSRQGEEEREELRAQKTSALSHHLTPCGRLGGPFAGGTEGGFFSFFFFFFLFIYFFCAVRIGGSCRCLRPSAHPRARLYRISQPAPPSLPPLPQSLAHTARASTSCVRSAGGVQRFFVFAFFFFLFFVRAQESLQTSSQRKRKLLCQLPGKGAFYCH